MSDADDDRPFPASPRRRAEAIERGDVAHSGLLTSAAVLLAALACAAALSPHCLGATATWLREQWTLEGVPGAPPNAAATGGLADPVEHVQRLIWSALGALAGGGLLIVLVAVAVDFLQAGLRLHPQRIAPDPARLAGPGTTRLRRGLNPLSMLAEATRWLLPCGLVLMLLTQRHRELLSLLDAPPAELLATAGALVMEVSARIAFALLLFTGLHYAWRRWTWEHSLRMTSQEVRDEQRSGGLR